MHHHPLAKGSKDILLKENQSTNKIELYFFVMAVVVLLTAGGGESKSRQSKPDIARQYCICRSSFCQS
jgi:hypothetical protein